jgi:hypothetical protein
VIALCDFASDKSTRSDHVQRAYDEIRHRYPNEDTIITSQFRSLVAKQQYSDGAKLLDIILTRDRQLTRNCRSELLNMVYCDTHTIPFQQYHDNSIII